MTIVVERLKGGLYAVAIGDIHVPYMTRSECLALASNMSAESPAQFALKLERKPDDGGPWTVSVQQVDDDIHVSWRQGLSEPVGARLNRSGSVLLVSKLLKV